MGLAVTVLLLRTLLQLRRSGETLPGLLAMILFMLTAETLRAVWLGFLWLQKPAPLALDMLAFVIGFIVLVGVPITVSGRYLPKEGASSVAPRAWVWLQRAMVSIAALGLVVLVSAIGFRTRAAMLLGPAAVYIVTSLLLFSRVTFYRHLQVRRRPLLLFVALMIAGLLVISGNTIHGILTGIRLRQSLPHATLNAVGLVLILIAIIFLFANARMADVIVKRAMRIVLWISSSVAAWLAVTHVGRWPWKLTIMGQDLLCLLILCGTIALTPAAIRRLNQWIEEWVFEQPKPQAGVSMLWLEIQELEDQDEVFHKVEDFLTKLLGLAAARLLPSFKNMEGFTFTRPEPYFVPASSNLARVLTPSANILVPLFVDGVAEYTLALSLGVIRPPLTLWEMDFVERVIGRVQIWLGMQRATERALREATFREELTNAELRALRAQVNPHFLFNSLNTIADLAVTAPDRAEEMTIRLSAVFRYVLVNTDRHFTSLQEELEFARTYLYIEQTRFEDRLTVIFDVDAATLEQEVPTLLLQPLIENALKHGLAPRREGGTLTIRTLRAEDSISITVIDDGVGLRRPAEPNERSTHVGVDNVSKRLQTSYGGRASFTLRERESGGTEAIIVIPRGREA